MDLEACLHSPAPNQREKVKYFIKISEIHPARSCSSIVGKRISVTYTGTTFTK